MIRKMQKHKYQHDLFSMLASLFVPDHNSSSKLNINSYTADQNIFMKMK